MITIDLSGKTAIVTGAGHGLGKAAATRLHAAGANVVVNYFEDDQGANRSIAEDAARELGERAVTIAADVRNFDQVSAMFNQAIEHFGSVDIVINNAGILADRTVKKMTTEQWQRVIDTNLTGVFHVCKAAAEYIADGGRIVSLSSISGFEGFFGQANYTAAKMGVVGLTKTLCRELAKRQVTVNAVAPGLFMTQMGHAVPEEHREKMIEQIPLGRTGEPDELACVILFLCSDLATYVTGQTIHVNGGWFMP